MTRSEQRLTELAKKRKHKSLRHRYLASPKGYGRGCLICGRMPEEHEDEPADQEEAGDVGESAGAAGGGDAGGGAAGAGAGGGV